MATPEETTAKQTEATRKYGESLAKTTLITTAASLAVTRFGESTRRFADSAVKASAALLATATATVSLASPGTTYRFQLALRDLGATIGRILIPVLEYATKLIRTVADAIMSLPPGLKDFLALAGKVLLTVGALALVFKTTTLVVGLVTGAIGTLTTALTAQAAATTAAAAASTASLIPMLTRLGGLAVGIGGGTALGTALGGDAATSALGSAVGTAVGGALGSFFGPLGTFLGMGLGGLLGGAGGGVLSKDRTSSVGAAVGPSRKTTGDELYSSLVTAALTAEGPGSKEDREKGMLDALRQIVANTSRSDTRDRSERLLTGRS